MGLKRQQSVNVNPSKTDQACKHQHSLTANDRYNGHSNRRRDHVGPILACENSRFFSLFASGNVSRGCLRRLSPIRPRKVDNVSDHGSGITIAAITSFYLNRTVKIV